MGDVSLLYKGKIRTYRANGNPVTWFCDLNLSTREDSNTKCGILLTAGMMKVFFRNISMVIWILNNDSIKWLFTTIRNTTWKMQKIKLYNHFCQFRLDFLIYSDLGISFLNYAINLITRFCTEWMSYKNSCMEYKNCSNQMFFLIFFFLFCPWKYVSYI